MRNMLRIMANTIVANLCTTRHVGLMDGKTGLCLFLHEYGRYMSAPFYTETANRLLYEVLEGDNTRLPYGILDGFSGIGMGLCYLIRKGFVKGSTCSLLGDVDRKVLGNVRACWALDRKYASRRFTSGLYMLARQEVSFDGALLQSWTDEILPLVSKEYIRACDDGLTPIDASLFESFRFVFDVIRCRYGDRIKCPEVNFTPEYMPLSCRTSEKAVANDMAALYGCSVDDLLFPIIGLEPKVAFSAVLATRVEYVAAHFIHHVNTVNNEFALLGLNMFNQKS